MRILGFLGAVVLVACGGGDREARRPEGGEGERGAHEAHAAAREEARDVSAEALDGWTKLGERALDPDGSKDMVRVGPDEGKFAVVRFVIKHGKVEIDRVVVTFADGQTWNAPHVVRFGQGSTSRAIDLPGERRNVRRVDFAYSAGQAGKAAQIEVWAR